MDSPGSFVAGCVNESLNPLDPVKSDIEYADHLRALREAGRIGEAQMFPTVLHAEAGDPIAILFHRQSIPIYRLSAKAGTVQVAIMPGLGRRRDDRA